MALIAFRGLPLSARHSFLPVLLPLKTDVRHNVGKFNNKGVAVNEINEKGTFESPKKMPFVKFLKFQAETFIPESKKLIKEKKMEWSRQPLPLDGGLHHGNYEVAFKFNTKEDIAKWNCTRDADNNEGYSTASFSLSKNRTGLFTGNLNTKVPKDGVVRNAGYVNISSIRPLKSFYRRTWYNWEDFNCLLIRVRGDGRAYKIVIGCEFYWDLNWLTRWQCPLFTRGGPYWQVAKIPFTKFYETYKGRIQDRQSQLPLTTVNTIGFTLADQSEGPFYLEIDSIALMKDVNLTDKHAYELYKQKFIVG